jgi:hypothetical protein
MLPNRLHSYGCTIRLKEEIADFMLKIVLRRVSLSLLLPPLLLLLLLLFLVLVILKIVIVFL